MNLFRRRTYVPEGKVWGSECVGRLQYVYMMRIIFSVTAPGTREIKKDLFWMLYLSGGCALTMKSASFFFGGENLHAFNALFVLLWVSFCFTHSTLKGRGQTKVSRLMLCPLFVIFPIQNPRPVLCVPVKKKKKKIPKWTFLLSSCLSEMMQLDGSEVMFQLFKCAKTSTRFNTFSSIKVHFQKKNKIILLFYSPVTPGLGFKGFLPQHKRYMCAGDHECLFICMSLRRQNCTASGSH